MPDTLTILTGASSNHFHSLCQLLNNIKKIFGNMNYRLIVYDLGLSQLERCKVQVLLSTFVIETSLKTFDYGKYPAYFDISVAAGEYAWKPVIIEQTCQEYGRLIIWVDSGNLFLKYPDRTIHCAKNYGIYTGMSQGTISDWIHPATLKYMDWNDITLQMRNASFIIINWDHDIGQRICREWKSCAMIKECIAPDGSDRGNHRQDQSVLTILYYKYCLDNYPQTLNLFYDEYSCHNDIDETASVNTTMIEAQQRLAAQSQLSLLDLGKLHGTDKVEHGFLPEYAKVLDPIRFRASKIGEIGVFFGASIIMWRDYFPGAIIYGLDAFNGVQGNRSTYNCFTKYYDQWLHESQTLPLENHQVKLCQFDQGNIKDILSFTQSEPKDSFDMFIDDGSHTMRDQQLFLNHFLRLIKPGGYLIIEDVHTSNQLDYDVRGDKSNTTLAMIEKYLTSRKWDSIYFTLNEEQWLNEHTSSCFLCRCNGNSLTCIIQRK